jgi:sulfur-oxidizing protein SoxY
MTYHHDRRDALKWGAALPVTLGLGTLLSKEAQAFEKNAFEAKTWADALKALGLAAPMESKDVVLNCPDIAENGAVVPIAASCALPGVKKILFFVEKNPSPLVAIFNVSEDVLANFSTRTKMSQTSDVMAVVVMQDSKALVSRKEIKVTLGGCGG